MREWLLVNGESLTLSWGVWLVGLREGELILLRRVHALAHRHIYHVLMVNIMND